MKSFVATCLGLWAFASTQTAEAFPQFVKDGYFSCSSCHVSSGGGDLVTPYGRGFAEQKLVMASYEGEASPVWKNEVLPDSLLLGGHVRWLQVFQDSSASRSGSNLWMQRDFDVGATTEHVTGYLTLSPMPLDASTTNEEDGFGIRKWVARGTINENYAVTLGSMTPKFGLMLNDHNAYVRRLLNLGPGTEYPQVEGTYMSEAWEVTMSGSVNGIKAASDDDDRDKPTRWTSTVSTFLWEKHRLGLSGYQEQEAEQRDRAGGLFGTLTFSKALTSSFEFTTRNDADGTKQLATYLDLVWEVAKGVWIQPTHETSLRDRTDPRTKLEKQAMRLSLFPRPHFDLKLSLGQVKSHQDYSFYNYGSILVHYWL